MKKEEFLKSITEEERKICAIYAKELIKVNPSSVLEIGSGWGLFARVVFEETCAFLITIDKQPPHQLKDFQQHTAGFENRMRRITGDSVEKMPEIGMNFDFIFIDGSHEKKEIVQDLENSWHCLKNNGIMMVDDVLHRKNWEYVESYKDFNYDITRSFWAFIQKNRNDIGDVRIHAVGNGVAIIERHENNTV